MVAKDFRLTSVRLALFSNKPGELTPSVVLGRVLGDHHSLFDGQIMTFPLPEDAPSEIPRLTLASADGSQRLEVGPQRLDIHWNNVLGDVPKLEDIIKKISAPILTLLEPGDLSIGRCAVIVTRQLDVQKAADILRDKFCKKEVITGNGPLKRTDNFEIHNHKKYTLKPVDIEINSWVRCKAVTAYPTSNTAILVEQDLNTPMEQLTTTRFNKVETEQFYDAAIKEIANVLTIYFG